MFPCGLAGSSHHQQVSGRGVQVDGWAASLPAQEERAGRAQSDDGHESVVKLAQLAVGVGSNAVMAIAIKVEPDRAETHAVPTADCDPKPSQGLMGK
jgi:hypothetical protein